MRNITAFVFAAIFFSAVASNSPAQVKLPKYVDDGSSDYATALVDFHQETGARIAKKKFTQPFAVAFFGWKAMRLSLLPYNSVEATHIRVCSIVIGFFDDELKPTLKSMADRSASETVFITATEVEKAAIQKFVVQKYTKKYVFDIDNFAVNPKKQDPLSAWKYELGSSLGELAGMLTQWFSLPGNAKYDASVAASLKGLDNKIKEAPAGVSPDLIANLKKLSAFGSQQQYSLVNQHQIGAALKAALLSTMSFVN